MSGKLEHVLQFDFFHANVEHILLMDVFLCDLGTP